MAELADAKDLGSFTARRAGSSPVTRIKNIPVRYSYEKSVPEFLFARETPSVYKTITKG